MNYSEIRKINVNEHVEKKNGLTYLSWAWAVDQMLSLDPEASWEYPEPKTWGETVMVFCTVTMFGKKRTAQLPVMDYKNKAIPNPDAFAVNTAMQRCLAKAISLHGLGLYIYAGEDVPPDAGEVLVQQVQAADAKPMAGAWEAMSEEEQVYLTGIAMEVIACISNGDVQAAYERLEAEQLDGEEKVAIWTRFDSKQRSALTKYKNSLKQAA